MELAKFKKPALPVEWNYESSVKRVKGHIYKWTNLTEDIAKDLWVAREKLSARTGRPRKDGTFVPTYSWDSYCEDIGSCRRTVNRWLSQWFDESMGGKLTGNAENYTPTPIIEKVRNVLGGIDLDPASCEMAQETVKAEKYYTQEKDGLSESWSGCVFLNPPYGMPQIREFTDKLIDSLPDIESAILLTNDQTDTLWWQKCAINAQVICMPSGRISFYTPTKGKTAPLNGQTFFYYGDEEKKFRQEFSEYGLMLRVI